MPIVAPLIHPYDQDDAELLALCIWREARNQNADAMRGVKDVILNRMAIAPAQGFAQGIRGNILKRGAFSSFSVGDPNAVKYPSSGPIWDTCRAAASSNDPDPTKGAVFYHSEDVPAGQTPLAPEAWGPVEFTITLDHLHFFRLKPA